MTKLCCSNSWIVCCVGVGFEEVGLPQTKVVKRDGEVECVLEIAVSAPREGTLDRRACWYAATGE